MNEEVVRSCAARKGKQKPVIRWALAIGMATALGATLAAPVALADEPGSREEPELVEDVIYERGQDGYFCFRIPAVVETNDGTLLAFAEARQDTCGDSGDIDTVVRRSDDNGATWGPIGIVHDAGGDTAGNPSPVVDAETGRIALITTHNPASNHNLRTPFLQYSEDDGRTWSEPQDIGEDISDPDWQKWLATGPGAGIQLTAGPHAGRMVIGMNHEGYLRNEEEDHYSGGNLAFSDDGGLSWQRGAIDQLSPSFLKPQELSLAELPDGRILVSARDQHGSAEGSRAFAISSDGGETFDSSFETDSELYTPVSQGAITSFVNSNGEDRVLFSGGSHPRARVVMSIRSSFDGGASWQTWDEGRVINWGNAGYSDITPLSNGKLGMIYETGDEDAYREIRFAQFNTAYLDEPNDAAPGIIEHPRGHETPDLSSYANPAYVRGEPHVIEGVHGNAFEFDLASGDGEFDDRVDVPYSPDIDLGDEKFTISTWFRYGDESHNQTLIWAYHMGSGLPGVWVRAEPAQNRIRAHLGTETGERIIQSSESYNDKEWHHLAFTRDEDSIRLWVDGEIVAEGAAPAGSVTKGGELLGIDGIFLGQRLDGVHRLAGAMDDVRVYGVSLSEADVVALAGGSYRLESDDNLRLHLPFDEIDDGAEEPGVVSVVSAGAKLVGNATNVWGVAEGAAGESAVAEALVDGEWVEVGSATVADDDSYVIELSGDAVASAGEYTLRVRVGETVSEEFSFERVARTGFGAANFAPTGREANVWGTVDGSAKVSTQVYVPGRGWSTSQVAEADANGWFAIPLTYGANSAGEYRWRVVVEHEHGEREFLREFTQTRVVGPSATTAGSAPTGREANVWGTATADASVWTEVYLGADRGWSKSQQTTANSSGGYVIPLTYGHDVGGTYRFRVATQVPEVGVMYSDEFSFVRTVR